MSKLIVTAIFLPLAFICKSQDLSYSQFYEMPLLRNPALAGLYPCNLKIGAAHRSQWASVTVPYQTSAVDVQFKFPAFNNDFATIGMQVTYDVAGDVKLKRTQLLPALNYHLSLSEDDIDNYISAGFMAGPVHSQFDPTLAKLDDQFVNQEYTSNNITAQRFNSTGYSYFDLTAGIAYSSSFGEDAKYHAGVAMYHLNSPKIHFYSSNSQEHLAPKYVLNGGVLMPTSDNNRLIAYADFSLQAGNRQFIGGGFYETDLAQYEDKDDVTALAFGLFYRWADALVPMARLTIHGLQVGLSYDANVSKLTQASKSLGGFELSLSWRGCLNISNPDLQKTKCRF